MNNSICRVLLCSASSCSAACQMWSTGMVAPNLAISLWWQYSVKSNILSLCEPKRWFQRLTLAERFSNNYLLTYCVEPQLSLRGRHAKLRGPIPFASNLGNRRDVLLPPGTYFPYFLCVEACVCMGWRGGVCLSNVFGKARESTPALGLDRCALAHTWAHSLYNTQTHRALGCADFAWVSGNWFVFQGVSAYLDSTHIIAIRHVILCYHYNPCILRTFCTITVTIFIQKNICFP